VDIPQGVELPTPAEREAFDSLEVAVKNILNVASDYTNKLLSDKTGWVYPVILGRNLDGLEYVMVWLHRKADK
jgi:hypothetical protein